MLLPMSVRQFETRCRHASSVLVALLGALAVAAFAVSGCAKPPPPKDEPKVEPTAEPEPPATPTPQAIETGKECATATVECAGGVCLAKVKNDCPEPITCDLESLTTCTGETQTGEARGKGRGTVPAKSEGELSSAAGCEGGQVQLTMPESLACR